MTIAKIDSLEMSDDDELTINCTFKDVHFTVGIFFLLNKVIFEMDVPDELKAELGTDDGLSFIELTKK